MPNPSKKDLTISPPSKLLRLSVEAVGERDQVWAHVRHLDGSLETYFTYLDEGYTVVLRQMDLLRDALVHDHLDLLFHFEQTETGREFHSVTVIRRD